MDAVTPGTQPENDPWADVVRAELPALLSSARQARSAVRRALAAWGMDDPDGDAELLASELVANAAQHGSGPVRLELRRDGGAAGERAITCEVTDTSPGRLQPRQAGPGEERGRGLAIVAALATSSGVRAEPDGKTSWFTLALRDGIDRVALPAEPEPEAGA